MTRRFGSRGVVRLVALVLSTGLLVASCSSDGDDAGDDGPDLTLDAASTTTGPDGDASATTVSDADGPTTTLAAVEPGTADAYTQALLANLTEDPDNTTLMNAEQAACVAPKWVEAVTPARFGEAGLVPEALAEQQSLSAFAALGLTIEEANGLYDVLETCGVDVRAQMIASLDEGVGDDARGCLEEKLTDDLVRQFAAIGLSGDTDGEEARAVSGRYLAVLQECGVYGGG